MTKHRTLAYPQTTDLDTSPRRAATELQTALIRQRKDEHLDIVLSRDVDCGPTTTGFEAVRFVHQALPELALSDIDLSTAFLGRKVRAPVLISSMTGGPSRAAAINENIATVAQSLGLAFGVGSQRIALETGQSHGIDRNLRRKAPDVPILANLGAAQLSLSKGAEMARRAVDMIEADGLIIHLNPLQEAVQERGDRDWREILSRIGAVCRKLNVPVIVKEVGCGISGPLARRLLEAGVAVIDIAGAGGTSWAAVEAERAKTARARAVALAFRSWGLPTAFALRDVRAACPGAVLIASGGLRDGVDSAKAIRLGADMTAFAAAILPEAIKSTEALRTRLEIIIEQLRIACFCTGSRDLAALRSAGLVPASDGANCDAS